MFFKGCLYTQDFSVAIYKWSSTDHRPAPAPGNSNNGMSSYACQQSAELHLCFTAEKPCVYGNPKSSF
ncbi:hypothetical protein GDO78_021111 [Eleutherodactylus coqui]|nr:hypothetical protein GDO78_021111 [Eleutherodactylus coqui]